MFQGTTKESVIHLQTLGIQIKKFGNPTDQYMKILAYGKDLDKFVRIYEEKIAPKIEQEQLQSTFSTKSASTGDKPPFSVQL